MKIIFTSPFNPLWSKGVSEMATLLDANVVSIGDLLRAEEKRNSALGKEIATALDNSELLKPELVNKLLSQRFFEDSDNKVLVNYPINIIQAESLAEHIKKGECRLSALVVVNTNKESITDKFESQFHCADSRHPKLETSKSNPECEICGNLMARSYDFKNYKLAHLVDSYFDKNGVLSGVSTLSRTLGIEAISYTTPKEVVGQILSLNQENV